MTWVNCSLSKVTCKRDSQWVQCSQKLKGNQSGGGVKKSSQTEPKLKKLSDPKNESFLKLFSYEKYEANKWLELKSLTKERTVSSMSRLRPHLKKTPIVF